MNQYLQHYFNSFKQRKIIIPFFIDTIFWFIISLLLLGLKILLQKRTAALSLFSPEQLQQQLQQLLLTSPDQAQALAASLKYLVLTIIVGGIFFLILFLLLYSLSRALMWNRILGQKSHTKNYWKWNTLSVVLLLPALFYLFIASIAKVVLSYLFTSISNPNLMQFANNLVLFIFLLIFLPFIFLVHYSFALKYQVWESIGNAFYLLKLHWPKLWKAFLFILGTVVILNLTLLLIQIIFFSTLLNRVAFMVIAILFFLLFLSWTRLYIVNILQESSQHHPS